MPFFVVSTSAPLLQMWFANTGHPSARDPYFLYSASNVGSMVSLLGYPLFIEPNLSIVGQAWLFAAGFGLLAAMVFFCGQAAANPIGVPPPAAQRGKQHRKGQAQQQASTNAPAPGLPPSTEPPPAWSRKLKWIALAFVPSSLMLGVTFHMSTDIASIPLMWVIPLTLYLVTFIIAFGRVPDWFRIVIGNLAPVMILLLIFVLVAPINTTVGIELFLHIATFFTVALMCHYELARDRPSPQYLTEFFLLMSVGGMLGGVFNSLVAPLIFTQAYEYKLVLLISCLMVPKLLTPEADDVPRSPRSRRLALILDIVIPVILGVAFYYLMRMADTERFGKVVNSLNENLHISKDTIVAILIFAVPVMVCFFFVDRPLRFALCAAAILAPVTIRSANSGVIHTERSFFGILKIEENTHRQRPVIEGPDGKLIFSGESTYYRLVHGTTLHGTQMHEFKNNVLDMFQCLTALNPWDNIAVAGANHAYDPRQDPLTYYHRTGPVGAMFRELYTRKNGAGSDRGCRDGWLGNGERGVLCAEKGQTLTFYEIDPAVKHLVADTDKYFTFVSDARTRGANVEIHMGDARLKLKEDADRKYSLLLVDAFSSDAIPVHLLTRQAVELYLNRMPDDGILALHISNKYVSLEPVVAQIVEDIRSRGEFPDLAARLWSDGQERGRPGKTASSWIVLARNQATLGTLARAAGAATRAIQHGVCSPDFTQGHADLDR